MSSKKSHIIKRILLNKYTINNAKRLSKFLNRNLSKNKSQNAQKVETLRKRTRQIEVYLDVKTRQFEHLRLRTLRTEKILRKRAHQIEMRLDAKTRQFEHLRLRTIRAEETVRKMRNQKSNEALKARIYRARLLKSQQLIRGMVVKTTAMKSKNEIGAGGHLVRELLAGESLPHAFLKMARESKTGHDRIVTRSLAFKFRKRSETQSLGALVLGAFMYNDQLYETSLEYFNEVDRETILETAAREYFGSWLFVDAQAGRESLMDYISAHFQEFSAEKAFSLVEILIQHRFYQDVQHLMETIPALIRPPENMDEDTLRKMAWVRARLAEKDVMPPSVSDEQINLAIMDYKLLDRSRTSSNRGDYVQTLASLANICRFQNVTFAGDTPLSRQLENFKADIHVDRRLEGPQATVVPVALDRDYASGRTYQPNTWLICNGWFMHRNFRGVIDFPFPQTINPIFISFHINDPDVLTSETVAELRKYEPIGCRDWTTVYRLRDFGISCFFSGCLTTSIGQILPKAENLPEQKLAAVETPVDLENSKNWTTTELSQIGDYVRDFSLTDGILDAKDMLTSYLDYSKIETSRLHCYLPCRSMGLEVDFRPKNRSDIRFEGLLDLNSDSFERIRTGIEAKLETMLGAIFAGQSEKDVMALWRKICAADVAQAELYYEAPLPAIPSVNIPAALKGVSRRIPRPLHDNAVEVAFALDENLTDYLPAVLHSVAEQASRSINVHLIYRGLEQDYLSTLEKAFPNVGFQFLDFSQVYYGSDLRLLSHTTQSTLDRLYLPEVLKDVAKVAYLDIDLLVRADLAEVFDYNLDGYVLAGKFSNLPLGRNVVRLITRASLKLPPQDAWTMRRRLHRQMESAASTFNAGVILMNLSLMRAESFTSNNLYLVTQCYCNDQDALNIYAAGRVKEIPQSWNSVAAQDYDRDPKLIHWAGSVKPWSKKFASPLEDEFDKAMNESWLKMRSVGEE